MTSLLAQVGQAPPVDVGGAAANGPAEFWVFWLIAPIALGAAIAMLLVRNAVHSALLLVLNFFAIAVLYAVLEAQFLAVVQIIVYAGAIMVLFLFVLMLIGGDRDMRSNDRIPGQKPAALVLGLLLVVGLTLGVAGPFLGADAACNVAAAQECAGLATVNDPQAGGNLKGVGGLLFTDYVWPFEVTSVLLVIAAVGAMVLGRRHEDADDVLDTAREPRRERTPTPPDRSDEADRARGEIAARQAEQEEQV
jgi:NADH-quinone oxidoreductase subunit J